MGGIATAFAVAVMIAIVVLFATTIKWADTRTTNNETPPGTTSLAKPHPPLDRLRLCSNPFQCVVPRPWLEFEEPLGV